MGQFSWMSVDNHKQPILENSRAAVLIPKDYGGGFLLEDSYEGYGIFGGRDVYALVVAWNDPQRFISDKKSRDYGIDIACYNEDQAKLRYPIKIIDITNKDVERAVTKGDITYESFNTFSLADPNQGWGYPDDVQLNFLNQSASELFK